MNVRFKTDFVTDQMSELGRKAVSLKLRNNGIFWFDPAESRLSAPHNKNDIDFHPVQ